MVKVEFKEAMFWEPLGDGRVRCNLCHRRCIIPEGSTGVCNVRVNINGKLYSKVYGKLTAANIDPIEKKPLFHVYPGGEVMSISTVGCNFKCLFCCNWVLSQETRIYGRTTTPEEVVRWTLEHGAQGISYTYNEPTVFYEFAYDTAKLAKKYNLINTFVTNGYMTPEAVDEISKYLDAATVDFKGNGNRDFYRKFMGVDDPEPIFETLKAMKEKGIFIEITDLVVPIYGDKIEDLRKLVRWIVENLGPETPFHVIRFHPDYKMLDVPSTPVKTLEEHAKVAMEEGLKYVYIGNVPGHSLENTKCPECGNEVIKRFGFEIIEFNITDDNRCTKCGTKINILGKPIRHRRRSWLSIF